MCQQLITDVYLYKVEPAKQELTIKLKGRIVSEFGTTKLEDLKSKSDEYTGKFEPVDDKEESAQAGAIEETTRLFESGSFQALPERRKRLSTAAKTYLIGGIAMAALTIVVVIVGVTMLTSAGTSKADIDTSGGDGSRVERWPSGSKKAEWHVSRVGGEEVPDGLWQEWHEDGSQKLVGQYVAGNQVGVWRAWHANGRPASESEYSDGKPVGTWTEWHSNGVKALQGSYVDGKKDGEWRTWHTNGAFASSEKFDKGEPVGDWNTWYDDGKTKSHGLYLDGLRADRWVIYHDNGVEERSEVWKDGILDGETFGNFRNRQRSFEGTWKGGKRSGTWTWWYINGEKAKEGAFEDGLESGEWTEWHQTGGVKLTGNYLKGQRDGEWRETDEDGNLAAVRQYRQGMLKSEKHYFRGVEVQQRQTTFADGSIKGEWTVLVDMEGADLKHGYMRAYYPSGKLAELGAYVKGEKDGPWRSFDEDGNVINQDVYEDGRKAN
ncbi:MAG: toxin-antitoxin system YwqK family antitoxin [Planctomycetes bacterium]|nr:toxin-antitoxin system YwqK family antitoxin [Planctomycetota bacterium]